MKKDIKRLKQLHANLEVSEKYKAMLVDSIDEMMGTVRRIGHDLNDLFQAGDFSEVTSENAKDIAIAMQGAAVCPPTLKCPDEPEYCYQCWERYLREKVSI